MQRIADRVVVSASDLVGFHDCEHLTFLDRRAVEGSAIKRLATLRATREEALNDLLRGHKLVDLYRGGA